MGVKLYIEAETPLDDDDRDILAGLSVMILAIANRQNLADQRDPEMQPGEYGADGEGLGDDGLTDEEREARKGMN